MKTMLRMIKVLCVSIVASILLLNDIILVDAKTEVFTNPDLNLYSESYLVYDATNHRILIEKNKDKKMYPASLTKMMTVYLALQLEKNDNRLITLDESIFKGLLAENASMAGFEIGEQVRFKDLIYGAMLPSGAEACRALAVSTKGSVDAFVDEMNLMAKKLGMKHTNFVNTSGLHDKNHYTTAEDMRKLLEASLKDERFLKAYRSDIFVTKSNEHHPYGVELEATRTQDIEALDIPEDFFEGSKTGYTTEAGKCLATSIWDEDIHLLYVGMGADGDYYSHRHFEDAYHLLSYYQQHYQSYELYKKDDLIEQLSIKNNINRKLATFYAKEDISLYLPNTVEKKKIKKVLNQDISLVAPYQKNEKITVVSFYYEGSKLGEYALKAQEDIKSHPFLYVFCFIWWWISDSWIRLLFFIVILVIGSLYGISFYNTYRKKRIYQSRLLYQRKKR